jgi:hypothetical protein
MKKSLMIGSALLLMTAAIGAAIASSEIHVLRHDWHEPTTSEHADRPLMQIAEKGERERHAERRSGRRHHDDEEGERHNEKGRARLPQTGPADANAPMPDNGLFNNKMRPKVEVQ